VHHPARGQRVTSENLCVSMIGPSMTDAVACLTKLHERLLRPLYPAGRP
jgi:hypothetical protein